MASTHAIPTATCRYQSTVMGSYQTLELIETFINYRETIKRCICIIFDPLRADAGALALKALRLREPFIDLHKAGSLTSEKMKNANVSFRDIFEEIPISVHNSSLGRAVLATLDPGHTMHQAGCDRLDLSASAGLERSLAFLNDCLDDVVTEQQKVRSCFAPITMPLLVMRTQGWSSAGPSWLLPRGWLSAVLSWPAEARVWGAP